MAMNKILVTGGMGFIGSCFIRHVINEYPDCKIVNYDSLTYAGNLRNLDGVSNYSNYNFVRGDICDKEAVSNLISSNDFDKIINFAAESHVDKSISGPSKFVQTNIVGTSILLEESLKYYRNLDSSLKNDFRFIHISTDEVFGDLSDTGKFTEKTPYNPSSPYSASKASSDHLVRAWHRTYGLPVSITNCSNNYGPFQNPEKLIPLMINNALSGKVLPVYGNGSNIRDWLYVYDHCDAILTVIENGVNGETYNIGGEFEISNIKIVKKICRLLDKIQPKKDNLPYESLIKFVSDRPGHDYRYAMDITKIRNELGWSPKESFETGIMKTVRWYLDNQEWVKLTLLK
tara:strand:- start:8105 stop:9139 length:1035 start_codon:yes stop_codon:yes gene_type:complete